MDDNPYFSLESAQPFEPAPLQPGELFRGPHWSVYLEGEVYRLEYVSGEHGGRLKKLPISQAEAEQLMANKVSCENVLLKYGAS